MGTALPARTGILVSALVSVLMLAGCGAFAVGATTNDDDQADTSARTSLENTANPRATGAARFLPDFAGAGFPVRGADLSGNDDPLGSAAELIDLAVGDPRAPRNEVNGVEASTTSSQIQKTVALTTTAMNCLGRKGHLALHAYTDTRYGYSTAIAFVVNPKAFRDVDVSRCAITSVVPYAGDPDPDAVPSIAPCVGQRRTGAALVTWVATTDSICTALGDPVEPVERSLRQGSFGTDVARLQLALNDVGSELTVDGRLGLDTVLAIRAFQNCYALAPTQVGVADPTTLNALGTAQSSGWSSAMCGG